MRHRQWLLPAVCLLLSGRLGVLSVAPRAAGGRIGCASCMHRRSPVICMAKGDGKKSRPRKSQPEPPSPPPAQTPPRPGRVNSDSPISVRKQIALVRSFKKQSAAGPAKPAARTSFRRSSKTSGRSLTNQTSTPEVEVDVDWGRNPQLFIDGYNVINVWPRLKKRFVKGDLLTARELLLENVADFAINRYEATVVFDANGASDRVEGQDRFDEYAGGLVTVVYAHDSADAYIERETKTLRADGRQVKVATSDNGIAIAASAHGATVMSSKRLVSELKASRKASQAVVVSGRASHAPSIATPVPGGRLPFGRTHMRGARITLSQDEFNKKEQRRAGPSRPLWEALDASLQEQWDATIKASVAQNSGLSKAQLAAMDQQKKLLKHGELESGAAARRRQLEQQRARARRRREMDGQP